MQYSFAKSCLLALAAASAVFAQTTGFDSVTNPDPKTPGATIPAGKPFTITWEPSPAAPLNGKINIVLLQGKTNTTLQAGKPIATGIDGSKGSFVWDVPTTTPFFPTYGFELALVSDPTTIQYSTFFSISGLSGGSASGSASASASASGSTSSSASESGTSTSVTTAASTTSTVVVTTSAGSSSVPSSTGATFSNTTMTTATKGATGSGTSGASSSATSSGAATTQSTNAAPAIVGGSGLAGAIVIAFGLLL